eukprot:PITA_13429
MDLSLSPEKCEFLMTEGTVLGHSISQQGLQVDPNKVAIIQRVPPPQKQRDVHSFLRLAGYYKRFIKDFSKLASPLFCLLAKDSKFIWSKSCQEALDILKGKVTIVPILRGPNWALPFHIHADASHKAIGAALGQFDLTIVDRSGKENVVAEFLSRMNLPVGDKGMVDDQFPYEHLFSISVLSPWFADIENYLVFAQFPSNLPSREKRKIIRKSAPFTWIGSNLFKLGRDQILRICVKEVEVFDILLTCHDGPCGGHFAAKGITFKWGIDFIGPINPPSKKKKHIIVCTDHLNKWAETKAIKVATDEKVVEFLRENIFYKFGYPRELVTDQGSQFTSSMIEEMLKHHKIKRRTSTPYHPQANGKVEVTNRALENILTKVVKNGRKDWAERLVKATWAYNTTWKTTIGFTPYELVYGKKALLSTEFEYNTLRMVAQLDLDLSYAKK